MHRKLFLTSLALWAPLASAQDDDDAEFTDMGPAAFMWPADRVWSAAADNTAPCGSVADPSDRTDFPLQGGRLAMVAQDPSWEIELSIAYSDNPTSNDDFTTLIDAEHFRELDPGHTCVKVEDSPGSVRAGDFATFQVKYIANFDKPENETFYACADIVMVTVQAFDIEIPCFNATGDPNVPGEEFDPHDGLDLDDDEDGEEEEEDPAPTTGADNGGSEESNDDNDSNESGSGGGGGLSGGAIAGIVVGSIAGVALLGAGAFMLYRRKQQRKLAERQHSSSRGVKWENRDPQAGSMSSDSVRMQNLSTA